MGCRPAGTIADGLPHRTAQQMVLDKVRSRALDSGFADESGQCQIAK
ncbi:hypothetical protein ABTY96_07190 [Streptomyces sp. NPDC096057]